MIRIYLYKTKKNRIFNYLLLIHSINEIFKILSMIFFSYIL